MLRSSLVVSLALLTVACSPKGKAPLVCSADQSICLPASGNAYCANLQLDATDCGACGDACATPIGGAVRCSQGACQFNCGNGFGAAGSKVVCGTKGSADGGSSFYCTDTAKDHENCGACGNACTGQQACVSGQCLANGTTACSSSGTGTVYVDLMTDRANCGSCGNTCAASEACTAGSCQGCAVAQCSNVCVDTQKDQANCGGC